jgi:polysaccharide export outer membrane protein
MIKMRTIKCFLPIVLLLLTSSYAFAQNYNVGEGDVLKITVHYHEELDTTSRVNRDGSVIFPLLGQVEVAGLTVMEISDKISALLGDGYVKNPHVTVYIERYRHMYAAVIGEVVKPGLYELGTNTTILELLSKSGGRTREAGNKAIIRRKGSDSSDKTTEIITINLKNIIEKGDIDQDVEIMDGDSVFISKTGVFYVMGEIMKPNAYKYKDGTTVIKAITVAGGFTERANTAKVRIIRKANDGEEVLEKVRMDELVLPDDLIMVPESLF